MALCSVLVLLERLLKLNKQDAPKHSSTSRQ